MNTTPNDTCLLIWQLNTVYILVCVNHVMGWTWMNFLSSNDGLWIAAMRQYEQ
jgi:hypothetical protein